MFRACHSAEEDRPAAIVYPAHTMAGYATIRALGEKGIQVLALAHQRHPHLRSRWATPVISPNFATDPGGFIDFVNGLADRSPGGAVLYVMEDVFAYLVHRYRERLSPRIRYPFLDEDALIKCLDKQPMLQAAEAHGIPIPWTRYDKAALDATDIPFPCLIKPLVSRFSWGQNMQGDRLDLFPRAFGGKCVRADTPADLRRLVTKAEALGIPVCVQALVPGPSSRLVVVFLYADADHRVLGAVSGRKLRQFPADFGTATLLKAEVHDRALALSAKLVQALDYHGITFIEFKEDGDGELRLMELNPRSGHGTGLALQAGVNLPYLQYADLLGWPVETQSQSRTSYWLDELGDWRYFRHYSQAGGSDRLPWYRWLASLRKVTPAIASLRDPLPGLLKLLPAAPWRQHRPDVPAELDDQKQTIDRDKPKQAIGTQANGSGTRRTNP